MQWLFKQTMQQLHEYAWIYSCIGRQSDNTWSHGSVLKSLYPDASFQIKNIFSLHVVFIIFKPNHTAFVHWAKVSVYNQTKNEVLLSFPKLMSY